MDYSDLKSLATPNLRVTINNKVYKLLPISLKVIIRIQQALTDEKNKNPYQNLLSQILQSNLNSMLQLIYFALNDEDFEKFNDVNDFVNFATADKKLNAEEISKIVFLLIDGSRPDFQEDKKKIKKGMLAGSFLILIFSIIGLIATILWLVDMVIPYLNSLI